MNVALHARSPFLFWGKIQGYFYRKLREQNNGRFLERNSKNNLGKINGGTCLCNYSCCAYRPIWRANPLRYENFIYITIGVGYAGYFILEVLRAKQKNVSQKEGNVDIEKNVEKSIVNTGDNNRISYIVNQHLSRSQVSKAWIQVVSATG